MSEALDGKFITAEEVLIGYLDLCGTSAAYKNLDLKKQVNRISRAVGDVWTELSNVFGEDQRLLYVHMFADSVVIAQRSQKDPQDCLGKLVRYFFTLQFQMLRHDPPTLSRCMVKKGKYYGIIFAHETKIDDLVMNFSLVGGPTVVEMDNALKGLPAGVYIDRSLASQYRDSSSLVPLEAEQLDFVKPSPDFVSFVEIWNDDLDRWVQNLIDASNGDQEFIDKISPWAEVIQGRSNLVRRKGVADSRSSSYQ